MDIRMMVNLFAVRGDANGNALVWDFIQTDYASAAVQDPNRGDIAANPSYVRR
jgi:hypothetical protein